MLQFFFLLMTLSLASMDKLLRKAGAFRVSDSAKEALRRVVELRAEEIAVKAVKFARHAGRRTVLAGDVKLSK